MHPCPDWSETNIKKLPLKTCLFDLFLFDSQQQILNKDTLYMCQQPEQFLLKLGHLHYLFSHVRRLFIELPLYS